MTACTHLGRPHGRPDPRFDVAPVRARLAELIPGVELLDNLRFDPGEEAGDPAFVDRLVAGQDYYVDDAFGSAHRAHASIVGPPTRLPSAAGRLLAGEVEALSRLVTSPRRPFVAVLGGAKISDKLGFVAALLDRVDTVVIGGAMCFTFLAASGQAVGDSAVEWDRIDECRRLLSSGRILLPTDFVVARSANSDEVADSGPAVPDGWAGRDIGPESSKAFAAAIAPDPLFATIADTATPTALTPTTSAFCPTSLPAVLRCCGSRNASRHGVALSTSRVDSMPSGV